MEKHMWCPKCQYITSSREMNAKIADDLHGGCWLLRRLWQPLLGCLAWDVKELRSELPNPWMRWIWWGPLHSGTLAAFTGVSTFHLIFSKIRWIKHFGQTILAWLKWCTVDFRQPWKLAGTIINVFKTCCVLSFLVYWLLFVLGALNFTEISSTIEEGLYTIIAVFLVLRCTSPRMFGQRLLRKVGRQFLTSLFISLCTPQLLFPSSPTNCIQSIANHPIQKDPISCQTEEFARFSLCVLLWFLRSCVGSTN